MRPNIFGKAMALNGDKTTTGATCIATIRTVGCHQNIPNNFHLKGGR